MENTKPICPECGSKTFVEHGEEDYINIWCANFDCEWFTEVDIDGGE